ncbi:hypothetical protein [Natronobeatus ordinarius]|uniref:hypothetical protein n=1 Tax=Natronobeatus ordinarius TaxID=2963433 RepID=UPI0020CC6BBB|nr:hypothetical protein [Natronobeatus ordinarius]
MSGPRVPRNSTALYRAVERIFDGVDAPPSDYHAVVQYMNEELPRFEQATVSYLVLGSYRGEYGYRLREFANRLNMPATAESIVLGDTMELTTTVIPEFDIKLNLLGEAATYIAGVYEKEDGGESPELGVIRALFSSKTFVLPRDYVGVAQESLNTREDIITAALTVYYSDASDEERKRELLSLLRVAEESEIEITERELTDILLERDGEIAEPPASYSWVHLSLFKRFEALNRCYPWTTLSELRAHADELPGPTRPKWETEFDPNDLL